VPFEQSPLVWHITPPVELVWHVPSATHPEPPPAPVVMAPQHTGVPPAQSSGPSHVSGTPLAHAAAARQLSEIDIPLIARQQTSGASQSVPLQVTPDVGGVLAHWPAGSHQTAE
jgi:hypothetical protein